MTDLGFKLDLSLVVIFFKLYSFLTPSHVKGPDTKATKDARASRESLSAG